MVPPWTWFTCMEAYIDNKSVVYILLNSCKVSKQLYWTRFESLWHVKSISSKWAKTTAWMYTTLLPWRYENVRYSCYYHEVKNRPLRLHFNDVDFYLGHQHFLIANDSLKPKTSEHPLFTIEHWLLQEISMIRGIRVTLNPWTNH